MVSRCIILCVCCCVETNRHSPNVCIIQLSVCVKSCGFKTGPYEYNTMEILTSSTVKSQVGHLFFPVSHAI